MRAAVSQVPNVWNFGAESSAFLLGPPLSAGNVVLFFKLEESIGFRWTDRV